VERCLGGEWCVQLRGSKAARRLKERAGSPGSDMDGTQSLLVEGNGASDHADKGKAKTLKTSRSAERLVPAAAMNRGLLRSLPHNESSLNLVAAAVPKRKEGREKETRRSVEQMEGAQHGQPDKQAHNSHRGHGYSVHPHRLNHNPPPSAGSLPLPSTKNVATESIPSSPHHHSTSHRRSAPPTPPKRRKPPAVPIRAVSGEGVTMTAIKTSAGKGKKVTGGQ
jgi:hypothetical protein